MLQRSRFGANPSNVTRVELDGLGGDGRRGGQGWRRLILSFSSCRKSTVGNGFRAGDIRLFSIVSRKNAGFRLRKGGSPKIPPNDCRGNPAPHGCDPGSPRQTIAHRLQGQSSDLGVGFMDILSNEPTIVSPRGVGTKMSRPLRNKRKLA